MRVFIILLSFLISNAFSQGGEPDLGTLRNSGYMMGPGNSSYPVHATWTDLIQLMAKVDVFDDYVNKMISVLCSEQQNKSVLFVGEPTKVYRYIWARMASMQLPSSCPSPLWNVEVNIPLIEAGHMYVGQTEEYWNDSVLEPVDGKDAVLYFASLSQVIGLGSSSNDEDGVEQTMVSNIETGRFRAVAFINQYDYNRFRTNNRAYVMNAFAETIAIKPVTKEQAEKMTRAYFEIFGSHLTISEKVIKYLFRVSDYYQPNVAEPYKTLRLAKSIMRDHPSTYTREAVAFSPIETDDPYEDNAEIDFIVGKNRASKITLDFEYFETEGNPDYLQVYDGETNVKLDKLSGNLGAFSKSYSASHLKLTFISDHSVTKKGFKVKRVFADMPSGSYTVQMEDVRNAILKIVQVPAWMINRDFTLVKGLERKLEEDVVGVIQGKKDVVRLAKNGFVAGRTDEKPIASTLFVGSTGTGKSYIAKKLAEFLELKMITIDMTSFRSIESLDRFLDIVADHLIVNPYAIYLFEEIDKADKTVLDRLYFMLDEGIFYDKGQRPLFARGAFIIMTTNAGHNVIIENHENPDLEDLVDSALLEMFRPSFLNRFDARTIFTPFTEAQYLQLAKIMIKKKIQLLQDYFGWTMRVDDATIQFLAINGQSVIYGARPMERLIENTISTGLSEYQIEKQTIYDGDTISIEKVAGEETKFRITVNDNSSLVYEVETAINSGSHFNRSVEAAALDFRLSKHEQNNMGYLQEVFQLNSIL